MTKVRVLFSPSVDATNLNSQSLSARDIALRLDPERFSISLWYEDEPDPRLPGHPAIQLLKLPARRKTLRIFREMLQGYNILAYMDVSPASYAFLHLPRVLRRGTKAVLHVEAPAAQSDNQSGAARVLSEGVISRCDVYTGITDFVARDVLNSWGRTVRYILPLGVDTTLFTPPPKRVNSCATVLFAGTLIPRKGPQFVIDAAARFPETTFRLVGAGREGFESVLQDQIGQRNLKNVRLEGPRSQRELVEIMRASDIFLLPSRLEGIPKVTLEAAASGLPCVVFRDYETPSVVDGATGFQVDTVDEMMQSLGKLIADRSLREQMGVAAREHVKKFDWDIVAKQWQDAYLEIAGELSGMAGF
jgi:glycosyltransferase involved in cell wall biosynthesis